MAAARAIGGMGAGAAAAGPDLRPGLRSREGLYRVEAAFALARIGVDVAEAVRTLTETLQDKDANVRRLADHALKQLEAAGVRD